MASLGFIISLIMFKISWDKMDKAYEEDEANGVVDVLGEPCSFKARSWRNTWIFSMFFAAIFLILILSSAYTLLVEEPMLDAKIAMYEEQNTTIEAIVKSHMDFEATTYKELKSESCIMFPELKSDTLVQQQIEAYLANNQEIKKLKEENIQFSIVRFYLYFGK